jgi:hypothetical protein
MPALYVAALYEVKVAVLAVQGIRRMRGGAQAQLMLASDGNFYVVKFKNNPQHMRVLANELIASKLAEKIGLSVPQTDVVEVTEWLIANSPELRIEEGSRRELCSAGLNFGSRYVGGLMPGQTVDYLPEERLREVRNIAEFAGMLVIDKWTCNSNGRQAVFEKKPRERKYRATFVDQGFCFHAGDWSFPDAALRGVYARNTVYAGVTGWASFEPWLTLVEGMPAETLWQIAEGVPAEWYGGDTAVIERLMEQLLVRRSRVRELIKAFRDSNREPFPNWKEGCSKGTVRQFEGVDGVHHDGRLLM